jgi:hypothetical protein
MKMNKLLTAAVIAASLCASGAAQARDYMDKEETSCDKDDIEEHMTSIIDNGRMGRMYGTKLLYVKDGPVETTRTSTEVRCRIEIVTSQYSMKGIFRYHEKDGHSLLGWIPTAKK